MSKIEPREIVQEMKESYIDYAMSVIVMRALPDVRDGLKPVHRRILYTMLDEGLLHNSKFRKSATVVGACLGRYHPHGDSSVYSAAIRLGQDFSLRYPLVAGQGNIGSIDNPSEFAAMRYTEMKMSKMGETMLEDIKKETVDFRNNYDESRQEPVVLPSMVPQLLLNGSLGIAVGMATNIPPHNLNEVCDALIHLVQNPEASTADICKFIKAPDFPTGGIIYGKNEFSDIYSQGRGGIVLRGKTEIEEGSDGRVKIIITEIPYQVQKSLLIQQFAKLVTDKKIEGIRDIRDESDRKGMRIVIDLQKNQNSQKILNRFFKFSNLQIIYHLNLIALVDGIQPRLLSLREVLNYFLDHRKDVIYRRVEFDLKKAEARAHILEGLFKCLNDIDLVITIIKKSENRADAKENLKLKIGLTEIQAEAILETKLSTLAKMEQARITEELKTRLTEIKEYKVILADPKEIQKIIIAETKRIKEEFGDKRRTEIVFGKTEISEIDLIPNEETIIIISKTGYIKRINPSIYKQQHRGGKGVIGMKTGETDIVEHFVSTTTHSDLLFFTDTGKVFETKAYEIPESTRTAKGRGLVNFLEISSDEKVLSLITKAKSVAEKQFLIMGTKNGVIKKMNFVNFAKIRKSGLIAINLKPGDLLIQANIVLEKDNIILVTKLGKAICFDQGDLRDIGRTASGVRGIRLQKEDKVIAMEVVRNKEEEKSTSAKTTVDEKSYLLTISENGIAKKTDITQYKRQLRGGKGIKTSIISQKTGNLVYAKIIGPDSVDKDLIIISKNGQVIRIKISSVPTLSRSTQGVRIMRLAVGDKISSASLN